MTKAKVSQRNTQVVKVVIGERRGGRRRRTRRRMVKKEVSTEASPLPQPFTPSARDNVVGFNLFNKLAEDKKEELKKTEQGLTERATALQNRETELQNQELQNLGQSQRRAMLIADEKDLLRNREKALNALAQELDLKFRSPPGVALTTPPFASGGMVPPTLPSAIVPKPSPPATSGVPPPKPPTPPATPVAPKPSPPSMLTPPPAPVFGGSSAPTGGASAGGSSAPTGGASAPTGGAGMGSPAPPPVSAGDYAKMISNLLGSSRVSEAIKQNLRKFKQKMDGGSDLKASEKTYISKQHGNFFGSKS